MAKAVAVTATSVSEWEADKKTPREPTLVRLAKFLEVTPAYLRYGYQGATLPALRADSEVHPEGSASALARENERGAAKRTSGKKRA